MPGLGTPIDQPWLPEVPINVRVFFYKLEQAGKEVFYRRIEFYDEEHDRVLVFLTNHLELTLPKRSCPRISGKN
jgi:hypothetical protein